MESVLFVSPYRPGDRSFGSDTRTRSVLRWLSEAGMNVHFVYLTRKFFEFPPSPELRRWIASYHTLHVAGCESSSVRPQGWRSLTRSRSSALQQRWSHRRRSGQPLHVCLGNLLESTKATLLWINHTAYAPVVENLPITKGVTRILDTHDVLHLRDASLCSAGLLPEQGVSRDQERELLSRFDLLLAIQDRERDALQRILPQKKVITVGHTLEIRPQPCTTSDICFVGSQYIVNERELLRFLQDAWPDIRERCPETRLQVVGGVSKCPSIMAVARHDKRIVMRGVVGRSDDIYAGPAVIICPMWCGSGLSIKLAEGLAHGKAVVASSLAAKGLEDGAGRAFLVAHTPAEIVGLIVGLLHNQQVRQQLENEATAYASTKFSSQQVWGEFSEFLDCRRASRRLARAA
jgi:glycosyltransferase involved in cell wall biosynthesis